MHAVIREATTLPEAARDIVDWLEDSASGFTVGDWVAIGLAAAALYWIVATLRAATRLGPVEVEALTKDGSERVNAVTARLRERLFHSGLLPPPEVPAGSPQTDLISAIEASTIPQGAFIAKVLELLPRPPQPPQHKLGGTLVEGGQGQPTEISVWLKPVEAGTPLLETVSGPTLEDTISCAAAKIFMHISNDAAYVFPPWARWSDLTALQHYLDGVRALKAGGPGAIAPARIAFTAAATAEPENVLPQLQLANLAERQAALLGAATTTPTLAQARAQLAALLRYRDILRRRPGVVEARYRASVLYGVLATSCDHLKTAITPQVRLALGLPASKEVSESLHERAKTESDAIAQQLQPWYIPLKKRRLRHRLELAGFERRRLKRTVNVSQHCLRVRRLKKRTGTTTSTTWLWRAELWARRMLVQWWHMTWGRWSAGWQAHYNAGCFFALLREQAGIEEPD